MTYSSLEQYDRVAESRRAWQLLRVSEHLESVLGSVDIENEEELAGEVITALKAADRAYQRETGRYGHDSAEECNASETTVEQPDGATAGEGKETTVQKTKEPVTREPPRTEIEDTSGAIGEPDADVDW
ncbi:hypothetical protein BRC87_04785 [Halobacteriales archaeon QS_4_66_20]|nr:MAG: hypothetical protein BRC87_04785 [Halobacteriales archaeon QS_4_66_20]